MSSSDPGLDVPRLARLLALIAFVTAVFLFLAAERLTGIPLQVGIVAIGSVGVVTAIVGLLISWASTIGGETPASAVDSTLDRDHEQRPGATADAPEDQDRQ